jgi:hypothetical protein
MRIVYAGGGAGGLYFAILMNKPDHAAYMLGYPLPWRDPYRSVERYNPRFEFRFTGEKS